MSCLDCCDTKENITQSPTSIRGDALRCPFLDHCDKFLNPSELVSHGIDHHRKYVFFDKFFYASMAFGCCFISLLVKNEVPFLIYCFVYEDDCFFSAFHFGSSNEAFQYTVSLTQQGKTVLISTQPVVAFDEEVHCPRCMFGRCTLKFHKYSRAHGQASSRFSKVKNPNVDLEVLKSLHNRSFDCTIDILGLDCVGVRYDDNNNIIKACLRCIVCFEYMYKISMCVKGHVLCVRCKEDVSKCFCGAAFGELRCYVLEEISDKCRLPCDNKVYGCPFVGRVAELNVHEERCFYNPKYLKRT